MYPWIERPYNFETLRYLLHEFADDRQTKHLLNLIKIKNIFVDPKKFFINLLFHID